MPLVGEPLNRSAWLERWRKRKGLVHKDPYNRTKIKPKLDRLERQAHCEALMAIVEGLEGGRSG